MAVREIGRDAVKAAIREFRRRGPEPMLAKYGGGLSTHWYIEIGRSHFDQKLVIRAAHQHQGLGRLGDFNAGQAKGRLERLGYRVVSKRSERGGPVLVCRVAWMPGYQSNEEEARGGGTYVDEGNVPHESLNFRPVRQTYYGFVENGGKGLGIERLGARRADETIDGVSVLFCATDRETSEFLLTGWYTNATVHRHPIKRPGRDRLQREVYFTATDATVIPESERCFHLPRKRDKHKFPFGGIGPRAFVWYGLNDDRAAGFCESLHRYMTTRVSTQTPDEVVVESRKRRISERLERQGASRQRRDEAEQPPGHAGRIVVEGCAGDENETGDTVRAPGLTTSWAPPQSLQTSVTSWRSSSARKSATTLTSDSSRRSESSGIGVRCAPNGSPGTMQR